MNMNLLKLTTTSLLLSLTAAIPACKTHAQSCLTQQGSATQLIVDGRKMLIIGGELSNSAATCNEDIDDVMPLMKALGLNTVLVPAQWNLIEPVENKFCFDTIDRVISKARDNGLKVVFLWFGAWKNSMSCYAPLWFKQDTRRFPRAETAAGKPLEIASAFSESVLDADRRALTKLMEHINATDTDNTVIMLQVENEIGMLENARDHSLAAEKEYRKPVPEQLRKYLLNNKKVLHPHLLELLTGSKEWTSASSKLIDDKLKQGHTWAEMFGTTPYADEVFMAYYYALYVQKMTVAARIVKNMPMYVNAALNSRGRKPGEYPSAGPLAHLIDVWKAGAPAIDFLSPDIYDTGFKSWAEQYKMPQNPLFIPETRCSVNAAARAFYTFGEYDAIGFCPFAIDQTGAAERQNISRAYAVLTKLQPLLIKNQGKGTTHGLLFDQQDKERIITDGNLSITCRHFFTLPWDARATNGSTWDEGGAVLIKLGELDYLIAGTGVVVNFQTTTEKQQEEQKTLGEDGFAASGTSVTGSTTTNKRFKGKRIGIGYVDEVDVNADGTLRYLRRHNGDQSHQGRHARISVGDYKILHVRLYEY